MLSLANAPKTTFKVVFEDWEDKTGCQKDKTEVLIKYMNLLIKIFIMAFLSFGIIKEYQITKKVQKEYTINLAIFSKVWLLFAVIFIICFLVSGFLSAESAKENVIVDIVLLALIIFLCILSALFCRWHIDIDNKRIEYCSISGKNNCCYYDQITKAVVDEKNNMYIYSENGNV